MFQPQVAGNLCSSGDAVLKRTVLLCSVTSFLMGFAGSLAALVLAFPRVSEAQEARIQANEMTVVGENGADRIRLQTGPGIRARVEVLDTEGMERASFATGGPQGTVPEAAAFQLSASDGTPVMRLGVGGAQDGGRTNLILRDRQSQPRLVVGVDADGNPLIHFLDSDGNVTWTAP